MYQFAWHGTVCDDSIYTLFSLTIVTRFHAGVESLLVSTGPRVSDDAFDDAIREYKLKLEGEDNRQQEDGEGA